MKTFLKYAFNKNCLKRSSLASLSIGTVYLFVTQFDAVVYGTFTKINVIQALATYLVSYLLATYGAVMLAVSDSKDALKLKNKIKHIFPDKLSLENIADLAKFPSENPYPVLRVGRNANILYANDAAIDAFGFSGDAVEGTIPDPLEYEINKSIDTCCVQAVGVTIGDRIFEFVIAPIKEGGYANVYGRDITIGKKAQKDLEDLNKTLEEKVRERTESLETLNSDLESFNYSVSHDLRGPLRSLNGFSQNILDKYGNSMPDEDRDLLIRIRKNAVRMGEIIDSLLQLSHMIKSKVNFVQTDMSIIAKDIAENLSQSELARNVEFVIKEGLVVSADEGLLKVVLENLIGNAWKFTGKVKCPRIEIGSDIVNNRNVYFVRDNGDGFNMKYSDKLFESFQRLHSPKEFPGLGIGLAIVKKVLRIHGGGIWAESEPGKGATFYFTFNDQNG